MFWPLYANFNDGILESDVGSYFNNSKPLNGFISFLLLPTIKRSNIYAYKGKVKQVIILKYKFVKACLF